VTTPPSKGLVVELYLIYFGLAQSFNLLETLQLLPTSITVKQLWLIKLCITVSYFVTTKIQVT
jgi:hypothetical protein